MPSEVENFSCTTQFVQAIAKNGRIYSWGSNPFYQLHSMNSAPLEPHATVRLMISESNPTTAKLHVMTEEEMKLLRSLPRRIKLTLTDDQTPRNNNSNKSQSGPIRANVKAIVSGQNYTFYLTDKGAYSVGQGGCPFLATPDRKANEIMPVLVDFGKIEIVGMSVCNTHCVACSKEGFVFTWGRNTSGCLGIEENEKRLDCEVFQPQMVNMGFGGVPCASAVLALPGVTLLVNFRGRVFYWGRLCAEGSIVLVRAEQIPVEGELRKGKLVPGRIAKLVGSNNDLAAVTTSNKLVAIKDLKKPVFAAMKFQCPVQDIAMTPMRMLVLSSDNPSVVLARALKHNTEIESETLKLEAKRREEIKTKFKKRGSKLIEVTQGEAIISPFLGLALSMAIKNMKPQESKLEPLPSLLDVGLTQSGVDILKSQKIILDEGIIRKTSSRLVAQELPDTRIPQKISGMNQVLAPSPTLGLPENAVPQVATLDLLALAKGKQARDLWMLGVVEGKESEVCTHVLKDMLVDPDMTKKRKSKLNPRGRGSQGASSSRDSSEASIAKAERREAPLQKKSALILRKLERQGNVGQRFDKEIQESIMSTERLKVNISKERSLCKSIIKLVDDIYSGRFTFASSELFNG
jgi:hypothetical protein